MRKARMTPGSAAPLSTRRAPTSTTRISPRFMNICTAGAGIAMTVLALMGLIAYLAVMKRMPEPGRPRYPKLMRAGSVPGWAKKNDVAAQRPIRLRRKPKRRAALPKAAPAPQGAPARPEPPRDEEKREQAPRKFQPRPWPQFDEPEPGEPEDVVEMDGPEEAVETEQKEDVE